MRADILFVAHLFKKGQYTACIVTPTDNFWVWKLYTFYAIDVFQALHLVSQF